MAIDLSGLIQKIGLEMQGQTRMEKIATITPSVNEARIWLSKAKAYVAMQDSMVNQEQERMMKIGSRARKYLQQFEGYAALEQASSDIVGNELMEQGYRLLDQLGQTIRTGSAADSGETLYSITVSMNGEWGVDAPVITWTVKYPTLQQYLITSSRSRLLLKDTNSLRSAFLHKIDQKDILEVEAWDQERVRLYEDFHYATSDSGRINRGNTLEAFFLWESKYNGQEQYRQTALQETLRNSKPFYAGGDIGNKQIKGMNASVVHLGTLINTMYQTIQQVDKIVEQIDRLSGMPPDSAAAIKLNKALDKSIAKLLSKYGFK